MPPENLGNLAGYLDASAARSPAAAAVVDPAGDRLTYAELQRQSAALAAFLVSRGVRPGDRVAILIPKCLEAIVAVFGILKAGAVYVPLDPSAPGDRTRGVLSSCDVRAVIASPAILPALSQGLDACVAVLVVGGTEAAPADIPCIDFSVAIGSSLPSPTVPRRSDDLAYIIHTSGSTGTPKGVMITHANARSFIDWSSQELSPTSADRFAGYSPLFFDPSVFDVFVAIKHGASLHLISDDLARRPKDLARFIADRQLTIWVSTPSALIMLLQFGELGVTSDWSPRLVGFGGEVFPVPRLRELMSRWPEATFYNLYGPTETAIACTYFKVPSPLPPDRVAPFPIGKPCSHCAALVLDENGHEVVHGGEGILHIGGPSVFAGYWGRPAETDAAFIERGGIRWYTTGDVVKVSEVEGYTYVGRRDRMVKRRGFRIELDDIERALYQHDQVREVAVTATTSEENGTVITAWLVLQAGSASSSVVGFKTFCARLLPAYMIPDRFVFADVLPRTATGKVDYAALTRSERHANPTAVLAPR